MKQTYNITFMLRSKSGDQRALEETISARSYKKAVKKLKAKYYDFEITIEKIQ